MVGSVYAFNGVIQTTLMQGRITESCTYTVGANRLRIVRNETDRPCAINLVSLDTGDLTRVVDCRGVCVLDGYGISDTAEYEADTDLFDVTDFLRITAFDKQADTTLVTWTCVPTREYTLLYAEALTNGVPWTVTGSSFVPLSGPEISEQVEGVLDDKRFYRVRAQPPLTL